MTRNNATRTLMTLTPALLVGAVAVALVGGGGAEEASAGETSGAPVAGAAAVTPACLTDDLSGTLAGLSGEARSGTRTAVLQLTNTSGRTCQLPGRAEMALVTPPGELVPVPTREVGRAGAAIVLAPEASAWSAIAWDACVPGRAKCGVGVALQYIVDPESAGTVADTVDVPEADQAGIAMTALRVGPLHPDRDAALR